MKSKLWLALFGCVAVAYAATALTINDVIKMSKAGLSDDVIIQTLLSSKSVFQLTPQDTETLIRNGVSDHVIVAMTVKGPVPSRPTNPTQSMAPSVPRPIVSDYVGADNQPNLSSSTTPAQNAAPFVAQPSSSDYYSGTVNESVVRALPASPQAYYYATPPPAYYYDPYYYAPGPYYYSGPSVGFYFGRGGYWGGYGHGWGHGGWGGHGGGHHH
ncbi:MAG: hypothetical protein NT105_16405 [Verrucomicrobia bacterium]|nr:hypothetical protein [Verrucomicrobiota bacterium]